MEGIEYGYEEEDRVQSGKRKFLDEEETSSDDGKRARKLEKQARKAERRAKKEAKAARRESRTKEKNAVDTPAHPAAAEAPIGQAESGTWGNPVSLSHDSNGGLQLAKETAIGSAKKTTKKRRAKVAEAAVGNDDDPVDAARQADTPAAEVSSGRQTEQNAEHAQALEEQDGDAKKDKRKAGGKKGKDMVDQTASDQPRPTAESTKAVKGKSRKGKTVEATEATPLPASAVPKATPDATSKPSTKRKRAAQAELAPENDISQTRSTSSTPVPTARPCSSSFEAAPAASSAPNPDGFRTASRRRTSASSAAGPSTAKKSKETDDELRRKLRTSDAVNAWLAEQWRPLPELQRLEGLGIITYVRGKFSHDEKTALKSHMDLFRKVNGLSQSELVNVIMAKGRFKTGYDKFWVETAAVCPGRPIQAVKKYVQREYDPRGRQGPWSKEEDDDLKRAYAIHPNEWTKIAMSVGRTEQDCRDRYKNDLGTKDTRSTGAWTKEEEAKLIEVVKNVNTTVGNDPLGHEAPWDIVEEQMGGVRSRMQCRKKWQGQLRFSEIGNGARAIFSKSERPFLIKYISRQHADSESEIDWGKLASGIFAGLPSEALRNAFKAMKRSLKLADGTSLEDTLSAMEGKWPVDSSATGVPKLQTSTKELGSRMGRKVINSRASSRVISDESDAEEPENLAGHIDPAIVESEKQQDKATTKKSKKERKEKGLAAGKGKKSALRGNGQAPTSAAVSNSDGDGDGKDGQDGDSDGGGDDDGANESEIDDIV